MFDDDNNDDLLKDDSATDLDIHDDMDDLDIGGDMPSTMDFDDEDPEDSFH